MNIKRLIKRLVKPTIANETLWLLVSRTLVRGSQYLCSVRSECEIDKGLRDYPDLKRLLGKRVVLDGPFKGMDYSGTEAFCSALYPKILGSYEHELEAVILESLAGDYNLVVDVGAADGYYAVGFAMKSVRTKVVAYEQEARAREELSKLASANGVTGRIEIRNRCDKADILQLPVSRGLMIMDCEGFEDVLLDQECVEHLSRWDFIIETHDGFVRGVSQRLAARFRATHQVKTMDVIRDLDKADSFQSQFIAAAPREVQDRLLAECREPGCLRWLVCKSKDSRDA